MFVKDLKIAKVKRLQYIEDNWYNKSSYDYTWNKYKWSLKSINLEDWIDIKNFWKNFQFNTEYNADIKENDILEIDWQEYDVKWWVPFKGITFSRKMFIIVKK